AREALQELVDSIRQHGIIQPLIVRELAAASPCGSRAGARFELVAGERRWRAAQEIGLTQVPVIIRSANDLEVLELSLIENLQRADLNPIEEAQGYARLANEFGMRQEDIALKVGRSRAAVANALRLLDLHPQVQVWLAQNLISVGHAKVLLALKAHEEQLLTAETVLRRNATVRSTERLVARLLGIGRSRRKSRRVTSELGATGTAVEDLQNRLQQHLTQGWKVRRQAFTEATPHGKTDFVNLIAQFAKQEKATSPAFLLCSHYDTKVFDTIRFIGANDGGSSTGLLLELARVIGQHPTLASKIELVFFDGEEAFEQFSGTDGLYGSR